ncbi:hypothetical protein DYD83_19150 [Dickeya fangzhongdai]|uniref:Uncharacterized protein n=1 Tax=Dickeya fangzhongdai TaxID=1778540 RepID=A0A2K8QR11_9GAMM|nr:hypothetical protein CVE23_19075 [Dickeya fangzhongdai]AYH49536.1 hypothetical protein B6N31_18735 [Dickeya fangzhongdai]QOH49329.1 hypothetical protein DYD82_19150 [Dickeya fangzhongdai]QOH53633.1 hypothetical protein DYD83_19150 [Dickeya fangzhongdai]
MQVRWLPWLIPVTYLSKLPGIRCVAAFLQPELFRVYLIDRCLTDRRGLTPDIFERALWYWMVACSSPVRHHRIVKIAPSVR